MRPIFLLRVTRGAHNTLLDLEELEDRELDRMRKLHQHFAEKARGKLRRGESKTGIPALDAEEN